MPARDTVLGVVGSPVRARPDHDDGAADAKHYQPYDLATLTLAVPMEVNRHEPSLTRESVHGSSQRRSNRGRN